MKFSTDNLAGQTIGGVLMGTALGDSLGLPAEGLKAKRIRDLGWGNLRHRFVFGRGMCSDDTEHTLMVARALMESRGDSEAFGKSLAWKFRWWLLAIPAGVGLATARAILRLWFGFGYEKSGVWSAGNGLAMRCGIIGAVCGGNAEQRRKLVKVATAITHRDPRAYVGALAAAECVALCRELPAGKMPERAEVEDVLVSLAPEDQEWQILVAKISDALESGMTTSDFARSIGCASGVTGFVYHSVPVALFAWLRHGGRFEAIGDVIRCGGDADTVGAITGALVGATLKLDGMPKDLINGLWEWPAGADYIQRMAVSLTGFSLGRTSKTPRWMWPLVIPRNLIFLLIVLTHGMLRFLPGGFRLLKEK